MVFILLKKVNNDLQTYQLKPTKKTIETLTNETSILNYIKKHLNRGKTIDYQYDNEYLFNDEKYVIYITNTTKEYNDYIVLKLGDNNRNNMNYLNLLDCCELEMIKNYIIQLNDNIDNNIDNDKIDDKIKNDKNNKNKSSKTNNKKIILKKREKESNYDELENETGIDLEEEEEEEEELYLDNNSQYDNESEYDKENNTELDEEIELDEDNIENIDFDLENTSQLEEEEYNYPENFKNLNKNEL